MIRTSLRHAALLIVMGVFSAACASSPSPAPADGARPSPSSAEAKPSPGEERPVPEILGFSAPRLSGGTVEGSEFAGRDLAIWFWAPW